MYKYKKAELILNHQTGMDTFINECAILKYDENFKNIPLKFKPSEYQKQINKLKVVTSIKRETIKVSRIEKKAINTKDKEEARKLFNLPKRMFK